MKKLVNHSLLAIIVLLLIANSSHSQSVKRERINFDEGWRFHLGNASDPSKDFNYGIANIFAKSGKSEGTAIDPKFDDKQWRSIDIPHDWAVELSFQNSSNFDLMSHGYKAIGAGYPENSIGWYRKEFLIPAQDSGSRYSIQFDGIFRNSNIWLNGFYLGNNQSGYIGVTYDITDYINFKGKNVIVVRVDATQFEGWFYEGAGIYRHVWLNRYNNLHFVDNSIFIRSKLSSKKATISIDAQIENLGLTDEKDLIIQSILLDRSGKQVSTTKDLPLSLAPSEFKTVSQTLNADNLRLWSLEDPYLYRVKTLIKQKGIIIDQIVNRLGIREIIIDAEKGLYLNGKLVKVKGVNCHQDHAGVGSALPDYLQYYRIKLLKEMGANAYRTSHNAPTPELLDACDSLGMLVLDETRLLNSSPEYINQFERLITRDRNHPSIFLWSIGNEEGYIQQNGVGKRVALSLMAKQKQFDPSRTCTYAADLGNVVKGINEVIPIRSFNYREKSIVAYHKDHPQQPILGTEMGSTVTTRGIYEKDTINCYVPDQDILAPWWASKAEDWWPIAADNPWMMGGFVWTGFDYRGEPTPYQWPNISSHFGLMDVCGFPKNIYYYYQSWWKDEPVLHISPHWNWKGKEGQPIDVWVNSNADNIELFLNGVSLGKKEMKRNSHLKWSVPYQAGTLKAIAYKNGQTFESSIETTDEPMDVVVTPYKTTMIADGKDVTVINCSVTDKHGREIPTAQNLLKFTLTGDAKIIGVGNGNPSSHEPDKCLDGNWQRKLFNGKCQIIIQSGKKPDIIKLKVESDGVWAGGTEIHTVSPKDNINTSIKTIETSKKNIDKMLGADISFLPELENKGIKFKDKGVEKDAIQILKDHGFNYVRLRIFVNPEVEKGYSPQSGFCNLKNTLEMAKRVKKAGMKLLLDFHYSDYWADPGQQFKPSAWKDLNSDQLKSTLKDYTKDVINELKAQGTTPDMVQIGNEINHGMVWPDGQISNLDSLAYLIKAGIDGVKEIDPSIIIMLHIALGGQNDESVFWLNNMFSRGVDCDVIGLSYYPRWHGTLSDLKFNTDDLAKRYKKHIIIVEYSHVKQEVNEIAFNIPNGLGKGTCIWEPLSTWESIFDKEGNSNNFLNYYDELASKYLNE